MTHQPKPRTSTLRKLHLALALILAACAAHLAAVWPMLQAGEQGSTAVATNLMQGLGLVALAWAVFMLAVRLLAIAAPQDEDAQACLHAVCGIFEHVPAPERVRRLIRRACSLPQPIH